MGRELTVEAKPLDENHILGLREQFGHADVKDSKITFTHGFGFGVTSIAVEIDLPDGRHVAETINIHDLLTEWAKQVLNENGVL
jgi:hypothetical protein